jgi:cysteinyl-tRNA synthetase
MQLLDTLSNEKRDVVPLDPAGGLRLYVCGITPYSEAHLGHALHAIVFDVLRRYLDWREIPVHHVQNFTDVDDKLIDRANELGTDVAALAERHSEAYLDQIMRMNVLPAHEYPRVSERIDEIVNVVQGLVDNGAAYESGGDVYYRVRRKTDYGKLSKRDIDDLQSGARVDPTEHKEDPLDFALWKSAKPGEPTWDSPWGPGRPGWHIECSAMAVTSLGDQIDIHGGGADLIFPHHENEIAQSESFTGKAPFAGIWMHNALLQLGEDKMAKSAGKVIGIDEILERFGADALRMFVISSHYRSPVTYSNEALEAARTGVARLRTAAFVEPVANSIGEPLDASETRRRFIEAMDDDLNSPQALAALFYLAREINRNRDEGRNTSAAQGTLRELSEVLGFTLEEPAVASQEAAPFIELLIELRAKLRAEKQFELADGVRDGLVANGVELKDGPAGTEWSLR